MRIYYCNGICTSAYRKKNKCCAISVCRSLDDNKTWCHNHAPLNEKLELIKKKEKKNEI